MTAGVFESRQQVFVSVGDGSLEGELAMPDGAVGVVLFAHGSGSSRHSPRNRYVAQYLRAHAHTATLLIDLLSAEEEAIDMRTAQYRFDIGLLALRVIEVTDWLVTNPVTSALEIGYFGASTGAAAALVGAAERPRLVHAVVSRGGRPDLAGTALSRVRAPTLLIVGGDDEPVLELNRIARSQLAVENSLEVVPRATHLFEEPGALEHVARVASAWFARFLGGHEAKGAA